MSGFLSGRTSLTTVQTADIADDAITAAKIADNTIDLAQLAHQADGSIVTFGTDTAPVLLAPDTAGQVLTTKGAGALPAFDAVSIEGNWEFVSRTVASSSATIAFTGLASGYDYKIEINDVHGSADSQYMHVEYGTGATPTYQTSGYYHLRTSAFSNSSIYMNASGEIGDGDTMFCGSGNRPLDNASDNSYNFEWILFNPGNSAINTVSMWRGYAPTNEGPTACFHWGGGYREADEAVTAIKWSLNTGNFSDGNFMLFKRLNGIT